MEKFKEEMFNAIGLIGKTQEVEKPEKILLSRLENRMKYISKKLSSCLGYSEAEKKARYDEILNTMETIKEIFNVDI